MIKAVRVNDIILNETHPNFRYPEDIGAIKFTEIQEQTTETSNSNNWAKPYHFNIIHFPLINEIVQIIEGPSYDYNENSNPVNYYLNPLSVDGNVQHNELPDFIPQSGLTSLGKYFLRNDAIRRLKPYEGDLIIQGRFGNSIRFGSTIDNSYIRNPKLKNNWSYDGNIGDPITIITNGIQNKSINDNKQRENSTVEDINNDNSSIYLCSNQQITNFEVASLNNESYYYDSSKNYNQEELITSNDAIPENMYEDPSLSTTQDLPPEELQKVNELEKVQSLGIPYYDISPTENQKISLDQAITLSESYLIPEIISDEYLNNDAGSGFKLIHNIESKIARDNNINNYPVFDEEIIWDNLYQLHINCVKPILENFGPNNIKITSAYRTEEVNKIIGGISDSHHLYGYAIDLISINHDSADLFNWCKLYLPEWNQLIWEYPERGSFTNANFDFSWIHISYVKENNPKLCSMSSKVENIHNAYINDSTIRTGNFTHNIDLADKTLL